LAVISLTISIYSLWIIYSRYVVEVCAHTPDVPYGDHFRIVNRFCLTAIGSKRSRLRMSTSVIFEKSTIWKNKIEKGSHDAMVEYSRDLEQTLNRWLSGIPINNGRAEDRSKLPASEPANVNAGRQAPIDVMTQSRFETSPLDFDSQVTSSTFLDGGDSKASSYYETAPKTTDLAVKIEKRSRPRVAGFLWHFISKDRPKPQLIVFRILFLSVLLISGLNLYVYIQIQHHSRIHTSHHITDSHRLWQAYTHSSQLNTQLQDEVASFRRQIDQMNSQLSRLQQEVCELADQTKKSLPFPPRNVNT
jgi:hypothetical protein